MKHPWGIAGVALICSPLLMGSSSNGSGCSSQPTTQDEIRDEQETITSEIVRQTGMPGVKNAREKKTLKWIYELRDRADLVTYTYNYVPMTGEMRPHCISLGYPIPGGVQYSANESEQTYYINNKGNSGYAYGHDRLPQAEPNGLYMPQDIKATWVLCQNPRNPKDIQPIYSEPDLVTFPWRINDEPFPGEPGYKGFKDTKDKSP
jgi:hypothetical protein